MNFGFLIRKLNRKGASNIIIVSILVIICKMLLKQ